MWLGGWKFRSLKAKGEFLKGFKAGTLEGLKAERLGIEAQRERLNAKGEKKKGVGKMLPLRESAAQGPPFGL